MQRCFPGVFEIWEDPISNIILPILAWFTDWPTNLLIDLHSWNYFANVKYIELATMFVSTQSLDSIMSIISKYIIHTFLPDTNLFIRCYLNLSFLVIMILFPVEYFSENVSDPNSDFKISESAISLSRATISTIHLELCEIINIMHYSRIKYTKNFHFIPIRLLFLSNWSLLHFYLSSPYNFGPYSNKFSHSLAFAIFSWNGLFSDNLIKALLTGKCSGYQ